MFGDADAETCKPVRMGKLLAGWEKTKKDKHGHACYDKRRNFSPLVLSVDGMMGKEALVILSTLSRLMAVKMDEPISHVTGWVNDRIAISFARSYSRVHTPQISIPNSLGYPGTRTGVRIGIGFGAVNILRQNHIAHTNANSLILVHPYL